MGSLQAFDRDLIEKNQFVSIEKCLEFPLSDFIMEFSLFFNDKFLEQVKKL